MGDGTRTLRILIEYDGTDFAGWQRQPGQRTVQGCVEEAIAQITGKPVKVRGASRTDAGVHAAGQVASFDVEPRIPEWGLLRALNGLLPRDVAVLDVRQVPPDFDARRYARGKVYAYEIWNHLVRSPQRERTTWHVRAPLDLPAMRLAAAVLVGEHDFRGFRASDCERISTVRLIRRLEIHRMGPLVRIEIEATAFLKNMVRILVGTLAYVGRGRLNLAAVERVLETGDRTLAGVTAPPQGLTLVRVIY